MDACLLTVVFAVVVVSVKCALVLTGDLSVGVKRRVFETSELTTDDITAIMWVDFTTKSYERGVQSIFRSRWNTVNRDGTFDNSGSSFRFPSNLDHTSAPAVLLFPNTGIAVFVDRTNRQFLWDVPGSPTTMKRTFEEVGVDDIPLNPSTRIPWRNGIYTVTDSSSVAHMGDEAQNWAYLLRFNWTDSSITSQATARLTPHKADGAGWGTPSVQNFFGSVLWLVNGRVMFLDADGNTGTPRLALGGPLDDINSQYDEVPLPPAAAAWDLSLLQGSLGLFHRVDSDGNVWLGWPEAGAESGAPLQWYTALTNIHLAAAFENEIVSECGDGLVSALEECDNHPQRLCNTWDMGLSQSNYTIKDGGVILCKRCQWEYQCSVCGDGIIEGLEQCDGGTGNCNEISAGMTGDTPVLCMKDTCQWDTSPCSLQGNSFFEVDPLSISAEPAMVVLKQKIKNHDSVALWVDFSAKVGTENLGDASKEKFYSWDPDGTEDLQAKPLPSDVVPAGLARLSTPIVFLASNQVVWVDRINKTIAWVPSCVHHIDQRQCNKHAACQWTDGRCRKTKDVIQHPFTAESSNSCPDPLNIPNLEDRLQDLNKREQLRLSVGDKNRAYVISDGINKAHFGDEEIDCWAAVLTFDFVDNKVTIEQSITNPNEDLSEPQRSTVYPLRPDTWLDTTEDAFGHQLWLVNGRVFYYGGHKTNKFILGGGLYNPNEFSDVVTLNPPRVNWDESPARYIGLDFFGKVDQFGAVWMADWGHDDLHTPLWLGDPNDPTVGEKPLIGLGVFRTNIHVAPQYKDTLGFYGKCGDGVTQNNIGEDCEEGDIVACNLIDESFQDLSNYFKLGCGSDCRWNASTCERNETYTATPTTIPTLDEQPEDGGKTSLMIVGMMMGAAAVIIIILAVIFLLWLRRRRRAKVGEDFVRVTLESGDVFHVTSEIMGRGTQAIVYKGFFMGTEASSGTKEKRENSLTLNSVCEKGSPPPTRGNIQKGSSRRQLTTRSEVIDVTSSPYTKQTGAMVACKRYQAGFFSGRDEQEHSIIYSLVHPNVVRMYGMVENTMIMEYVGGGSLRTLLNETDAATLPPHQVQQYIKDILTGLVQFHGHNIIHRDIKPENILVTEEGTVKIADPGHTRHEGTVTLKLAGAVKYMAPEHLRGNHSIAQDIWPVGMLALEMSGIPPWGAITEEAGNIMKELATMEVDVVYQISEGYTVPSDAFRRFVSACCTVDVERRGTAVELLKHEYVTQYIHPPASSDNLVTVGAKPGSR